MRRVPHAHDPTTAEVEAARARAAEEAAEDATALMSDPAFASLRGVQLPAEFERLDRLEAAGGGGGGARAAARGGGAGAKVAGGAAAAAGAAVAEEEEEEEDMAVEGKGRARR